jgi:exonuclease III
MRKRGIFGGIALIAALVLGLLIWAHQGSVEIYVDEPLLAAQPHPAQAPVEFSIVAYNVQARPLLDDTTPKFDLIPPTVNPFDIVCFQEMFKDHRHMFGGLNHPVKVYHGTLKNWWRIVGSGLGTVSRFPLEGVESMHYSTAGDFQNKPASKGILLTRFRVGGLPLDVYTTHMEAGADRKEPAMISRRKQGEEMVAFVKQHSNADSAVIILGDFNMRHSTPDQIDPEIMAGNVPQKFDGLRRSHIFDSVNVALGLTDLCREIRGEPHDGVDHILFRSGAKAKLTPLSYQHDGPEFYAPDNSPLSDHEPVIGRFRIEAPGQDLAAEPAQPVEADQPVEAEEATEPSPEETPQPGPQPDQAPGQPAQS